jgi:RimJ/RimL family protein N-acetyltransferase/ubiquinone/menaquinone biosynthesis C-methylase UbiE
MGEIMKEHYYDINRQNWNERTQIHSRSKFYDLESIRAGRSALLPIEQSEVGDVEGKSLLHLQCHMGTDTVSWARLGAHVIGVDLSDEAIQVASDLRDSIGVEARFIQANVYGLPHLLNEQFDIVFASYGVLCRLHDISLWARIAASYVKPGGILYLADFHPIANSIMDGQIDDSTFHFPAAKPSFYGPGATYTDGEERTKTGCYEWTYNMGQVVSAICNTGLRLEYLHEHPTAACPMLSGMSKSDDGLWHRADDNIPLMFSLKARSEVIAHSTAQSTGSGDSGKPVADSGNCVRRAATPTLETEQLHLRPLRRSDAPRIQELFSYFDILKYLPAGIPWPYPDDGAEQFLNRMLSENSAGSRYAWALTLKHKGDDLFIGLIDLFPNNPNDNCGFWIGLDYQRKGYISEALAAVNDFAFDVLGLPYIIFRNAEENAGSYRLTEKAGATIIEIIDNVPCVGGKFRHVHWRLFPKNWRSHRNSFFNDR